MRVFKIFSLAILFVFAPLSLFAEFYSSSYYGWNFDLPEGFVIKDASDDGMSFYMEHEFMKVRAAIKMYPLESYQRSDLAMEEVLNKLNADGEIDGFVWNGRQASIAQYEFKQKRRRRLPAIHP